MTLSARVGSETAALSKVVAGAGSYLESAATTITLTAAQVIDGFFNQTGGTANAVTIPTAAQLVAAIPGCAVGSKFDFSVNNNGSGSVTLQAATGVTYEGVGAAVATTVASIFRAVVTNATLGAEAITFIQAK